MQNLNKPYQVSFFLLLLLLPNQLGLHLWPKWTIVQGLRIDYLSPTLYLSYFLIVAFLFSVITPHRPKPLSSLLTAYFLLFTFIFFNSSPASLLKLDQLLLLVTLGVCLAKVGKKLSWAWFGLPFAVIWTSILTIYQFFSQHSLGLWLLGERELSLSTPGVARLDFLGLEFLRPYGTFSHPNSLAGFILVSIFLVLALKNRFSPLLTYLSISLSLVALLLTTSRGAILTGLFLALLLFLKKFFSQKIILALSLVTFLFTAYCLLFTNMFPNNQSLVRRTEELRFSVAIWKTAPPFGIGLNNFIPVLGQTLPSPKYPQLSSPVLWLQPVHNVFILILVETGFLGFSVLVYFLVKTLVIINHKSYFLYLAFLGILLTSLADHYWFTLLQNQLLAALVFGLIWSKKAKR